MSKNRIIGGDYEQHILQNICGEDEARLVAVYGRRRVGKTCLVKYFFKEKFDFFTGDICEMKYSQSEYVVDRDYAEELRQRNSTFAHQTKTKDALHNVLVTTYGFTTNLHSGGIYATVTMDSLFSEPSK